MEQEHYYAIETKDNELKHYGVKGMHWGIRRYQPYTSNPRKDGKGGKFLGNKPKAKLVKDKKGSIGLTAALSVTAAAAGITAMKKVAEKRRTKNAAKKREEQTIIDKQKAKDGVEYMKQKLPENAQKDIQKAASKLADAENKMDDLYWTIEDGRATKDTWKKYDEAQKKYEAEDDNYRKTLQKWDFDIDGETEHSPYFYHELAKNNNSSDFKSGLAKDSKSGLFNPNRSGINSLGWNESRAKEEARSNSNIGDLLKNMQDAAKKKNDTYYDHKHYDENASDDEWDEGKARALNNRYRHATRDYNNSVNAYNQAKQDFEDSWARSAYSGINKKKKNYRVRSK